MTVQPINLYTHNGTTFDEFYRCRIDKLCGRDSMHVGDINGCTSWNSLLVEMNWKAALSAMIGVQKSAPLLPTRALVKFQYDSSRDVLITSLYILNKSSLLMSNTVV